MYPYRPASSLPIRFASNSTPECRTRRSMRCYRLACILMTALLAMALQPAPCAAQDQAVGQQGNVWNLGTLRQGEIRPTTLSAQNRCPGRRKFEFSIVGAPWLRVAGRAVVKVATGRIESTAAMVDLTGVEPGSYDRGRVVIRCLNCPPACTQDYTEIIVLLTVTADCSELATRAEVARRQAEDARRQAEESLEPLEAMAEELRAAKEKQTEAASRRQTLDVFLDDSSWIDGDRGRITRGDLELLSEARQDVHGRWKSGELSAEAAADAWGEIDAGTLEALRARKRQEIEQAKSQEADAERQVAEIATRMTMVKIASRGLGQLAERAAAAADAAHRFCEEHCARPPTVVTPGDAVAGGAGAGSGGGASTGGGGDGDVGDQPADPCPPLLAEIERLIANLNLIRDRNAEAARAASRAFWGDPDSKYHGGYKSELESYEVAAGQIAGQNQAAEYLYEIHSLATSLGGKLGTRAVATGTEAALDKAKGEIFDLGLETIGEWLEQEHTAERRDRAWTAYRSFLEHAFEANATLVAAHQVFDRLRELSRQAEVEGCPVPRLPCLTFYRFGFAAFAEGHWRVDGERPEGVKLQPIISASGPGGTGPVLFRGWLADCRPFTFWYRMFNYRWGDADARPPWIY